MISYSTPTYFISGHRNITDQEFYFHYVPKINEAMKEGAAFVIGDYYGVDQKAQDYLKEKRYDKSKVVIYHMLDKPKYCVWEHTRSGFTSDEERDNAMTFDSNEDIAWVRTSQEESGTAQNIARRVIYKMSIDVLRRKLELEDEIKNIEKFNGLFSKVEETIKKEWKQVSKEYIDEKSLEKT